MGIKIEINQKQLPKKYQKFNLIKTVDGVSDTVYLLGKKYVLKIFENIDNQKIKNEKKLLHTLKELNVPQIVEIFLIDGKKSIIYTQIKGKSLKKVKPKDMLLVGLFLKKLHKKTKLKKTSNKKLYQNKNLKDMIIATKNPILLHYLKYSDLTLKNNGIIHGDLFLDNAKMDSSKLGIYDFIDACEGDFLFDLAVVTSSWCFNGGTCDYRLLNALLYGYGQKIKTKKFLKYIKYALLYYATTREMAGRNYKELTDRISNLDKKVFK